MKTKKLTNDKQSVITKRDTMTMWYKTQKTQTK